MLIAKLLATRMILPQGCLVRINKSFFSEAPSTENIFDNSAAKAFYRKTIRNVNIKAASGRGKFDDQTMRKLTKLSKPRDINLLFEAYYNYMGHFTIMSNTTVDELVKKIILLAGRDLSQAQVATDKLIELLMNHDYLRYYPHYETIKECAVFIAKRNPEKLWKLLEVFKDKILIKLNRDLVQTLFNLSKKWVEMTRLMKLVAYRANRNLIPDLQNQQILAFISKGLARFENITVTKSSKEYENFLSSFESPSIDLALAWVIMEGGIEKAAQVLSQLPKDHPDIHIFSQVVLKIEEGEEETEIRSQLQGFLEGTSHSQLFQ